MWDAHSHLSLWLHSAQLPEAVFLPVQRMLWENKAEINMSLFRLIRMQQSQQGHFRADCLDNTVHAFGPRWHTATNSLSQAPIYLWTYNMPSRCFAIQ